jgi:hypothetical protein
MIIECCSQERSYSNFYGLVSERFCKLNRVWNECYERAFETYYETIHRYETNRLRNIARLFGHLFANDAISWAVMQAIKMNEDDTTSSSRIFVKIMMQEVTESMGLPTLKERFADPEIKALCTAMFPLDNPKNTRFAINYFTSIGLGAVTEEMREHLKVSQAFDGVLYPRANVLFSRTHLVLLWSNVARCWRPNLRLLTVHRRRIRPLTLHRQIPTVNLMRQMTLATAAALPVARRHRPVTSSGIRPAVGEMTVGHRLHHAALVGTRRACAGAMTAGRHRHLALAGMTIAAAMVVIVASPPRDIVDAATRFRGVRLAPVGVTSVSVSAHRLVEKAHETGTGTGTVTLVLVLVITTEEEMIHGRDSGIADDDTNGHFMGYLLLCSPCFLSVVCFITNVKAPRVPPI